MTKHNFKDSIPLLQQALHECHFVAFDCEMTGLFLDNNDNAFVDDMPARYEKVCALPFSCALSLRYRKFIWGPSHSDTVSVANGAADDSPSKL